MNDRPPEKGIFRFCSDCGGETPHELTLYGERCKKCGRRRAPKDGEGPQPNPPPSAGPQDAT
jgi:hypothetical protein